ncbi:MAG: peroxidase-related enzyme [Kiloniellales bacterium]|nr:peroxidase-related enzyme [Kiloniellales bacterium]
MPFLSSLPAEAGARDIFKLNKAAGHAMIDYHTAVMRQPSALSEGERELIAAYVSGLNSCQYCHGVHAQTAAAFGLEADLLAGLIDDLEAAGIDEKLRPILRLARKLTQSPGKLVEADTEAVLAAGWDERALHDAINVVCLFNFMNRLVEGHGIEGSEGVFEQRGVALKESGYAPLLDYLEG